MCKKEFYVVSAAVVLVIAVMFFPMTGTAGNLEPSGEPAPTMKTLDQIPPTWSQLLPADDGSDTCNSSRFKCVLGGAAVLDKETGLVWEKAPSTTGADWLTALGTCLLKSVGNRKGWRLPTVEELESLVDPSTTNSGLPSGHPFTNVQVGNYWSATTIPGDDGVFAVAFPFGAPSADVKLMSDNVWCVRGGQGYDGK